MPVAKSADGSPCTRQAVSELRDDIASDLQTGLRECTEMLTEPYSPKQLERLRKIRTILTRAVLEIDEV